MLAVIMLLVAVVGLKHGEALLVNTTFTASPLFTAEVTRVLLALAAPCDTLLIKNSYNGLLPPLVGVAVYVMFTASHTAAPPVLSAKATLGTIVGLMVTAALLVAVQPFAPVTVTE